MYKRRNLKLAECDTCGEIKQCIFTSQETTLCLECERKFINDIIDNALQKMVNKK